MVSRTYSSLVLSALLAASQSVAQEGTFKASLPENTLFFATVPDLSTSISEMQGMPLLQMWREGEVQDFFADSLQMAKGHWAQLMEQGRALHEGGQLPFSPDELTKLRVESFSFAITSLALEARGNDEPLPRFGLIVHADFGASADIWRNVVNTGLEMMKASAGDELEHTTADVAGTVLHTFRPAHEEIPMGLHVAFVASGIVVGTLGDEVKATVESFLGGKPRLSGTAAYREATQSLKIAGAETEVFMRPGGFVDFLVDTLDLAEANAPDFPEWLDAKGIDRVLNAIGARSVRSIAATSSYDGDRCISNTFVDAPAPTRRGFFAGEDAPLDLRFLRWVPKDAVSFSGSSLALGGLWDTFESALRAYDEETAKTVLGRLKKMEEEVGLTVRDDILGSFGNELITWSMPMAAFGTAPEMAILVKVKDEARLLKSIETITALTGGTIQIEKVDRRGITVYQARLDLDFGANFGGMNPLDMIVPTFAFKDGYMVCGLSTSDVKRVFKRMEREDDPSDDIRSNPEFARYLAEVPKQGLSSVSFTDWKAQFEGMYQLLTSVLAFFPLDDNIPFDLSLIPDSATLTRHLSGSVTWQTGDARGYRSTSVGPFGPETVAILVGLGVAGGVTAAVLTQHRR